LNKLKRELLDDKELELVSLKFFKVATSEVTLMRLQNSVL